jgi:hypothetical protein
MRNRVFRNATLCRWIICSRRFGISWMLFPSRVNQLKRKISTKQTLPHHKTTWIISNTDVPNTNLTYYARIWFQKLRKTIKSVSQDNNWPRHLPDTSQKRQRPSEAAKFKRRCYVAYARNQNYQIASSFSFTSFDNATRAIQIRRRRIFLPTFCVRGKILRKNEGHNVLLLTPNSFPNTRILPL